TALPWEGQGWSTIKALTYLLDLQTILGVLLFLLSSPREEPAPAPEASASAQKMAVQSSRFVARPMEVPAIEAHRFPAAITFNLNSRATGTENLFKLNIKTTASVGGRRATLVGVFALGDRNNSSSGGDVNSNTKGKGGSAVPSSNYMVPLDNSSSCITRPLAEILRDLNKRIADNIIVKQSDNTNSAFIPWYHANRMLSFYAPGNDLSFPPALEKLMIEFLLLYEITCALTPEPTSTPNELQRDEGWCGEIRDVIFSDTGSVTVVYRVTVRGSDGEAHRESTGTVSSATNDENIDPVAAAEEIAFCRACARFGLGLYLYHED
ncbi:hypothetical protein Ccrd_002181, partial [Cynara cardunculus var. scolymus]